MRNPGAAPPAARPRGGRGGGLMRWTLALYVARRFFQNAVAVFVTVFALVVLINLIELLRANDDGTAGFVTLVAMAVLRAPSDHRSPPRPSPCCWRRWRLLRGARAVLRARGDAGGGGLDLADGAARDPRGRDADGGGLVCRLQPRVGGLRGALRDARAEVHSRPLDLLALGRGGGHLAAPGRRCGPDRHPRPGAPPPMSTSSGR